ncbi:hypothetical protein HAHI6034_07405 [Hathewaya histolytica]|uniref:Nitrogen regulatory protein P-II n=1 Tax=Hathewaya histolytica TaxID=1498 RepID=A0A4U9QVS7_HATHI|nr:hypothetical protein [Hathewaya histolytica]VTQ82715.1 Uncharacterised protein [Hathewaya histolytica]
MQMLVFVLNKIDLLDDIISELTKSGIRGATVIDSTGMATVLCESDHSEIPIFGSLKMLLNGSRPFNKTIFTVLKDDEVQIAIEAIKKVAGDLSKPNTGILFSLPVNFVEGIKK